MIVAVTGLDGTGKSSQAKALRDSQLGSSRRAVAIHHASTKLRGVRYLKRRYHNDAIKVLKHYRIHVEYGCELEKERKGSRIGLVIGSYFIVGSFIKSLWYRWRFSDRLLILDRCFLDDVTKVRWRFGEVHQRWSWFMKRVPRPDLLIVLQGDPSTTYARKKVQNCSYLEYLAKGRALDQTIADAAANGWRIAKMSIDDRDLEAVHVNVVQTVAELCGE